jgi:hypothetical protein
MQWVIRFVVGGVLISLFATLGDVLKPKGFAGLFGAAPSVALATLALTIAIEGKEFASIEARSMIIGALAFVVYGILCVYLMGVRCIKASRAALGGLAVWGMVAGGLWAMFLK